MKYRPVLITAATIGALAILMALGACGELPNQPELPLTPAQAEETKVAVTETQDRLMAGISSEWIRREVGAELDALSASLAAGNLPQVRTIARSAAQTLVAYYLISDGGDGPDISAMLLMLNSVANTAGNTSPDITL
jgi:hypothetical protein